MLLTGSYPPSRPTPEEPVALPPVAARKPVVRVKFADRRVDNYAWLRDKEDPAVIAYLEAENAYTSEVMSPLADFREKLYDEMLARSDNDRPICRRPMVSCTVTMATSMATINTAE